MPNEILRDFLIADTVYRYLIDRPSGRVGLICFPHALQDRLATKRAGLRGEPFIDSIPNGRNPPATAIDPLVHLKLVGDRYGGGFSQGRTLRCSGSNDRFRFKIQESRRSGDQNLVITHLQSDEGLTLLHTMTWHDDDAAVTIQCQLKNDSAAPVTLELMTSFSIGGITPFHASDASGRLVLHRFRSAWSAEARPESRSIEEMHLERSWSGSAGLSERFGQVGSMPVRGFFPFVAVSDVEANVTWAAQLAWAGSWQMEAFRQHDELCLSGGLADREFGHWLRHLQPGQSFATPPAMLTCVAGDLPIAAQRLTALQQRAVDQQPAVEQDLPVVFNEWCTTWGDPQHEKVLAIADRIKSLGIQYLVIDAGWYKGNGGDWNNAHGDWVPNQQLFPNGLKATADAIRAKGLIPGLWFEFETVGLRSAASQMSELLLHRDGVPITVRERRFWDLREPAVVERLSRQVIGLLKECGFGYLKVDYNDTIGIGADGAESQGEGLRQHIDGVYRFFDRIRTELPDLVIENCSSGGHRLEPSMLMRTAMSSFSDAHELVEIPIIAANLHQLMLPRQSQIWAVLHPSDSDERLIYSLAATFLGRMCLSGDVTGLNPAQSKLVQRAIALYRTAAPVIKVGTSRCVSRIGPSWRHPTGWQSVLRQAKDERTLLVVTHAFANAPEAVSVNLPAGRWRIDETFTHGHRADTSDSKLTLSQVGPYSASVVLLRSE